MKKWWRVKTPLSTRARQFLIELGTIIGLSIFIIGLMMLGIFYL